MVGKFNLLDKKKENIAKKFKIVLAEKPNLQEAAEMDQDYDRGGTPIFTGVFEPLARVAL